MSDTSIHVAVGVIFDNQQMDQILIAKRPQHLHQGGLWEFPGGKVAVGETVDQALKRELFEELGIAVIQSQSLMQVEHNYSDKKVFLDIWIVTEYSGDARGLEGQECRWVSIQQLVSSESGYQFPEANKPILEKLKSL
jgi:8-oxo-dGTP diphosphatase